MTNPKQPDPQQDITVEAVDAQLARVLRDQGQLKERCLVQMRLTVSEAYKALHAVYEQLRESGHAYAWATAYEAAGTTGLLLADLGELLNEAAMPTLPYEPGTACRSTQHCATWGWCNRCDPRAADAGRHVVKAVEAMGIPPAVAGSVYAVAMEVLRHPDRPVVVPPEPTGEAPMPCNGVQVRLPHPAHTWQPQPGMALMDCLGYTGHAGEGPPPVLRFDCPDTATHPAHVWRPEPHVDPVTCYPDREDPCPGQ